MYCNLTPYIGKIKCCEIKMPEMSFRDQLYYADSFRYAMYGTRIPGVKKASAIRIKEMKIFKKQTVEIYVEGLKKKAKREITICVLIDEYANVRAGYSVRMLVDKDLEGVSEKISEGRARKDKTNMIDMKCGRGMDKKFILHSIADSLFIGLERGTVKIKGIR